MWTKIQKNELICQRSSSLVRARANIWSQLESIHCIIVLLYLVMTKYLVRKQYTVMNSWSMNYSLVLVQYLTMKWRSLSELFLLSCWDHHIGILVWKKKKTFIFLSFVHRKCERVNRGMMKQIYWHSFVRAERLLVMS